MCGIAGLVGFDGRRPDAAMLRQMIRAIAHRGPDAAETFHDDHVGLAHARLSIIDHSGGGQPMSNENGSLWVTFNGEIFNFVELRAELIGLGHKFASQSDTEVILHAYREWGESCVRHFNGQWAFAVWDARERTLFLSRDRLGVRPLFYTWANGQFLFASEVKSLLVHPDVRRDIDPLALDQLFTLWTTVPPRTIFRDIFELPPAHNLTVHEGQAVTQRYWHLDYVPDDPPLSDEEYADQLLELLIDATRLRLRADVPVGAYLSGGLDSSLTTALIRKFTDAPLRTFSVTFDDAEFDESRFQQDVVTRLNTNHQSIRCTSGDIGRVFPDVIRHAEKPMLRTAPAPLFLLSKLVREQGYKVVVTGEGADEMLGGYDIFKEAKVRRFWGRQFDSKFRPQLLNKLYPYLPNLQAQSPAYRQAFFNVRPQDLGSPFFSHLPRWELTAKLKQFFSPDLKAEIGDYNVYEELLAKLPIEYARWPAFCQAQYLETTLLLPGYILASQGDRVAMAHSVEGRFPFLDYRVAEFAARLPTRLKMHGLNEKHLLKKVARDLVPESVLNRSKQPYRAPDAKSFVKADSPREPLDYVSDLLSIDRIVDTGLFASGAVEWLVKKLRGGQITGIKDNMALVGILSTQILADQFLDPQPQSSPVGQRITERVST
jgi:asparagine synthase (glutamine-hydrolysing)